MAHQAVVDKDFLLVPCLGLNAVAQFVIDRQTGKLSDNTPPLVMVPTTPLPAPDGGVVMDRGAGPRHMAFSMDKKYAYVLNELQGTITVFAYDASKGTLGAVVETVLSSPPNGPREVAAAHPVVVRNFLYVSNRSTRNIGVFRIDPNSGKLTLVEHEAAGGTIFFPRDFTADPTGKFLVVANQRNTPENVANVLEINATDGSLTPRQTLMIAVDSQFVGILQLP
jgi:6-phosphogluconolactonase